jgi:hypothetical protein
MKWNQFALTAILLPLCLALSAAQSQGSPILDQSNVTNSSALSVEIGLSASHPNDVSLSGQSFTVGVTGILDHITVFIFGSVPNGTTPPTDLFEIRPTTASGAPVDDDSKALARLTITLPPVPFGGFGLPHPSFDIDVGSFQIPVTAGETLFFDFGAANENLALGGFAPPNYAGGDEYFRDPVRGLDNFVKQGVSDFGFQTYVEPATVPEPSSLTLCCASAIALLAYRRWTRRVPAVA